MQNEDKNKILGKFLCITSVSSALLWGHTTAHSAKIWLHAPHETQLYVRYGVWSKEGACTWKRHDEPLEFREEHLGCATVELCGLAADTIYSYQICRDADGQQLVDLEGLDQEELYFRTLPTHEVMEKQRLDFLIMSCHNPDKGGGYQVWETLPQILQESSQSDEGKSWIRFALLGGDQVYADDWEERLLKASTDQERRSLYLEVYRHFWSHPSYRKVLCKLPAYLMWDDHDITDGWGSREDSFEGDGGSFKPEWQGLFCAAKQTFQQFQSSRNPHPLSTDGEDIAFRVGTAGFVMADLRTHRNARKNKYGKRNNFRRSVTGWDRRILEHFFFSVRWFFRMKNRN